MEENLTSQAYVNFDIPTSLSFFSQGLINLNGDLAVNDSFSASWIGFLVDTNFPDLNLNQDLQMA